MTKNSEAEISVVHAVADAKVALAELSSPTSKSSWFCYCTRSLCVNVIDKVNNADDFIAPGMEAEDPDGGMRFATQSVRALTAKDEEKLEKQNCRMVTPFQAGKLEENARKYWDQFYNRNKTNFFKDRHWTTREFRELLGDLPDVARPRLLEIGCGVGNLIFPLVEEGTDIEIFACDFSPRAVEFVKSHELYKSNRIKAFQADVVSDDLLCGTEGPVDLVTMVFVLSAIHPDKFKSVIENVHRALRPGGLVLFRDYGIHDMTQIRFKAGHKISDNFYMRQDGTRSYFFSLELINSLFTGCGFQVITSSYIECRTVNKKEGVDVPRVFVQGKFKKLGDE